MELKTLLKIEYLKLLSPRARNIVLISLLMNAILWIGLFTIVINDSPGNTGKPPLHSLFSNGAYLLQAFFLGIIVLMNIGEEYRQGALRKSIIDGLSRIDYFTGKLGFLLMAVFSFTAIGLSEFFLLGLANGINPSEVATGAFASEALRFLIIMFLYSCFTFFLGFVTRGSSMSILIFLVYVLAEFVVNMLDTYVYRWGISGYLPLHLASSFADTIKVPPKDLLKMLMYLLLFLGSSYFILTKKDLK
jgi:ABC-2 type transport system permease protein